MQQFGILHDARQRRIAKNDSGVSPFEWLVLLIGAVCIVDFRWLFGAEKQGVHLVTTSTVVAVIVSTTMLLFELKYPFLSNIEVSRKPWREAVEHIQQIRSGRMSDMRM